MDNQTSLRSPDADSTAGARLSALPRPRAPRAAARKHQAARAFIETLLARAGIALNGTDPWDIRVHDERFFDRVIAEGSLGLGESYMAGWWDCRKLDELFHRIVAAGLDSRIRPSLDLVLLALRSKLQNRQNRDRVWRAAEVHYNLPLEIFEATFDTRLTGSCAYWAEATNLDAAQEAKLDLICRKLGLEPGGGAGLRVLDVGCGWGAFMGYAAARYGVDCVGVTISEEQQKYAMRRYRGLSVEARLQDYREFNEPVDHAVSMGMFEHVGSKNYRKYFETVLRCLKPGGLFVLHTIWANERSSYIDPWLDKYIFPNGVLPTVGQIADATEGLFVIEDVHNFGAYYDRTLMAWNGKFQSNRADIEREFGDQFCRMWEYYLLCCAGGFRSRGISVGQFVLSPQGVKGIYQAVR
jgi:cyclopropane-fatty-acyl-phospholipid synthase